MKGFCSLDALDLACLWVAHIAELQANQPRLFATLQEAAAHWAVYSTSAARDGRLGDSNDATKPHMRDLIAAQQIVNR